MHSMSPQICDFGSAKFVDKTRSMGKKKTFAWAAPEVSDPVSSMSVKKIINCIF